jgi:hypothetical protein
MKWAELTENPAILLGEEECLQNKGEGHLTGHKILVEHIKNELNHEKLSCV